MKKAYLLNYGLKPWEVDRIPSYVLDVWRKAGAEEERKDALKQVQGMSNG